MPRPTGIGHEPVLASRRIVHIVEMATGAGPSRGQHLPTWADSNMFHEGAKLWTCISAEFFRQANRFRARRSPWLGDVPFYRSATMQFLHRALTLSAGDAVEVTLDNQANVLLLDGPNFACYKANSSFNYHGGLAMVSPFRIVAPRAGLWHLTIDLGGYAGSVRVSVRTLRGR